MITYAIQAIRPEPTQTKAAALPPPAGMVAELKAFHKFQADKGFDYVVAAPAWHAFMQGALDTLGIGDEWYTEPPGLVQRTVSGETAWFLPGT